MEIGFSKNKLLISPKYQHVNKNLILLRIQFTSEFTKVDLGYQATAYYHKGGWVKISPHTFIRKSGTNEKLALIDAVNIPIAPQKLNFETSKDWLYFSLYFPVITQREGYLDLIEAELGDEKDFNFYDIYLDPEKMLII